MKWQMPVVLPLACLLSLTPAPAVQTQTHIHDHQHPVLGIVTFPITCTPEAQTAFNQAMKLQHSFWHQASHAAFSDVLKRDPECVMAYWGIALSLLDNPFSPPPPKNLADGWAALEQAEQIGAKTPREAGYIAALSEFYRDFDRKDHRTRVAAYEKAMEALHARYPDDSEAAIHYALALNVAAVPADKTYAKQLKAAEILEAEFARQPDHPGVAHYLIHTYDYPAIAERGVKAAERYSEIAASAPHALHMPSHIFTRLGYWDRSIEGNLRSADVARQRNEHIDELHALDYIVYAYLQTGRDRAAQEMIRDARQRFGEIKLARSAGAFAMAAMPARYVIERSAWTEAADLRVKPTEYGYADAMTHFARAVGLARAGRPDEATADVDALQRIAKQLKPKDAYWAEQVELQRLAATAWVDWARGKTDAAIERMRSAAGREAKTDKHPVTPGPLTPAREQLAEMLLIANRPAEALVEFEAVQRAEPNRLRPIIGAGQAAEAVGKAKAARRHYARALDISNEADDTRPELSAAKAFVAKM